MTDLFREDAYLREAPAVVAGVTPEGGLILDRPLFYPEGGGQPGDSGLLVWQGGPARVATTVKGSGGVPVLLGDGAAPLPPEGTAVTQRLDWDRRYRHMRMHTALHLLSVVLAFPVTGGQIGAEKGRLDFLMPEPPADPLAVERALAELVSADLEVGERWITEAELDASPSLVKTLSVAPPRGAGRIRLVRIGPEAAPVDLQPCGGTHVARTGEIGPLRLGKIENKGRQNRRVNLHFA